MPLSRDARRLLREILDDRALPAYAEKAADERWSPNPDEVAELEAIVADELSATGFREDWEPNERGLALENLINELNHHRM